MPSELSEGIAQVLAHSHDDEYVRQLYLEWAIDHWAAIELRRYAGVFDRCFAAMTGPVQYNDDDCDARKVCWPDAQALVHEDQNRNYVYVRKPPPEKENPVFREFFGPAGELHIYRYWLVPKDDEERDSHWQEWADHPPGKWGPDRPTLDWLIEHKGTTYNDCRDKAWIASLGTLGTESGMIYNYGDFKHALFNLSTLHSDVVVDTTKNEDDDHVHSD